MAKEYILKQNGLHERFFASRAKVQFFGGGYGNGKTSAMTVKSLQLAEDYPGLAALFARSTYPKLNDTLRKTFEDFCPEDWIASFPKSKNSENSATLTNGSKFNFRYISQKTSTEDGGKTSNLLSATYDLIVVDQIEDPEITYKDFLDLFGRLRGSTLYRGNDPTMPRTGPRWMMISSNPTRNWVYTKIIAPLKKYQATGEITEDLLCERDEYRRPILIDGKPIILIELFEGSTYENAHVLEKDFITTLQSIYTGQMGERFLKGMWSSYEGLVYPSFDPNKHMIDHHRMLGYLNQLRSEGYIVPFVESYDYGIASPSCYLLAFVDPFGNVCVIDGYYKKEYILEEQAEKIVELRNKYRANTRFVYGDPDIFRKKAGQKQTVGKSITELFYEINPEIMFVRGNNDIKNGIVKVTSYLNGYKHHINPFDGSYVSPYIFFSKNLQFLEDEFNGYFWKENKHGEKDDEPTDKSDHAMDSLKYLLSEVPETATLYKRSLLSPSHLTQWTEIESNVDTKAHRR